MRLLTLFLLLGTATVATGDTTPNIVFIMADDLGWADLGCYGSDFHETPRLDALAREGLRFTSAYAAAPVCSPTRASIMTGKSPAKVGLTDFLKGKRSPADVPVRPAEYLDALPLEEVTLAEALKSQGYATGHVGKWHLGGTGFLPEDQGFDFNFAGTMSGMPRSFFWPQWKGNPEVEGGERGEYLTDTLTHAATRFIRENAGGPFFLQLSHYAVHIPLEAKPELVQKYTEKSAALPANPYAQRNPDYAAMLESVDQSVGAILDTLAELGLEKNTIVLFTSDNGGLSVKEMFPNTPATTNAPLRAGKGYLYEGGLRVPLIMRWPDLIAPGETSALPVISHDLFTTLCGAAEAPVPEGTEGIDLLAHLRAPAEPFARSPLFWHYPHYSNQGGFPGSAVRDGRWKLIESHEDGSRYLYDLAADPGESRNLALQEPDRTEALFETLDTWRRTVNARRVEAIPRP